MKKKNLSTIALVLVFFVGLSVLLYPTISDYWNSLHQSQAIATYADSVAEMDEQDYEEMWNAAQEYNEKLFETGHGLGLKKKEKKEYNNLLNVSGTGIMSYIEIPKIKCSLPIYHGTDEGCPSDCHRSHRRKLPSSRRCQYSLCSFRTQRTSQCQALFQSGQAGRGRRIHDPYPGSDADL